MALPTDLIPGLRVRPIDRILGPFQRFARIEAAGGIMLLASTVVALVWANSPWREGYHDLWHTYVSVGFGDRTLEMSLHHFVNDGLMALFFFVVGLEIKREMIAGELASLRKATVPIAAAIGGMIVPAGIYALVNWGDPNIRGWGIPMATDIAFAIGIMALLGKRVPLPLKVFLTALAIVDDIGAVLVIAVFYTEHIVGLALLVAGAMILLSLGANRLGIRSPVVYGVLGIIMWVFLLKSGVHATIGGVLLALTIPATVRIEGAAFAGFARRAIDAFKQAGGDAADTMTNPQRQSAVHSLEQACEQVQTPLNRLEHEMHGMVSFLIMPIFALANAGITFSSGVVSGLGEGVGLGIVLGLFVGKPAGIVLATVAAVKAGLGDLPGGTTWKQVLGVSFLAGIGFTMSMFIANLAFPYDKGPDEAAALYMAKGGILFGSLISGVVGFFLLRAFTRPPDAQTQG